MSMDKPAVGDNAEVYVDGIHRGNGTVVEVSASSVEVQLLEDEIAKTFEAPIGNFYSKHESNNYWILQILSSEVHDIR